MTEQWKYFDKFREEFKKKCEEWDKVLPGEIIYNEDLDKLTENSEVRLILVADNPGTKEAEKNKYLIGTSGQNIRKFIENNYKINCEENVIFLNKTPIHTAGTDGLKDKKYEPLLVETQLWMAEATAKLHIELVKGAEDNSSVPELWLLGTSNYEDKGKDKGIFRQYKDKFLAAYEDSDAFEHVYVFKHPSRNNFANDLMISPLINISISDMHKLGKYHRDKVWSK